MLLLALIVVLGFNSSSVLASEHQSNEINAKITESYVVSPTNNQLERVKTAEVDANDLKVGDNEIYNDGETVVSVKMEVPADSNSIQPMDGNSGWSAGWIGNTATLHPNKTSFGNKISYTLFWNNNRIDSVYSLSYFIPGGSVTNGFTDIIRATPDGTYASAKGEVQYVITQSGVVAGSFNSWLRTDINSSGQVRLVWNY